MFESTDVNKVKTLNTQLKEVCKPVVNRSYFKALHIDVIITHILYYASLEFNVSSVRIGVFSTRLIGHWIFSDNR